jgi:hypothetical protein
MPMKFALRIRVQLGLLLDAKPKHVGVAMTRREPTQHFLWSMPTGTSRLHLSAPEPSIDDVACACNLYFSNQVEFTSSSPQFVLLLPFPKLDAAWRNTDSPGPGAMPCQPPPKAEKTDSAPLHVFPVEIFDQVTPSCFTSLLVLPPSSFDTARFKAHGFCFHVNEEHARCGE